MKYSALPEREKGTCPICGKVIIERQVFGGTWITQMCECEMKRLAEEEALRKKRNHEDFIKSLQRESGIPPLQRKYTINDFKLRKGSENALIASKRYIEQFGNMGGTGLIFVGNTGSGKTHLASAIANALLAQGINVKYAVVDEMLSDIKRSYDGWTLTESDILDPLKTARLLILDDLCATSIQKRDWGQSMIHSIIDHRINYIRPTIITTNLTEEEMNEVLDKRTCDRIYSACHTFTLASLSGRRR